MLRTSQYKYVLYDTGKNREQLYDMETDRGEMRNLAIEKKYTDILRQHRELLAEWMKKHPENGKTLFTRFIPNLH